MGSQEKFRLVPAMHGLPGVLISRNGKLKKSNGQSRSRDQGFHGIPLEISPPEITPEKKI